MSYLKADQLMQLATLMSSRHRGVTLDQVKEEFDVSHRTAQRMMRAIEQQFPEVQTSNDEQGHKRWRIGEITFKTGRFSCVKRNGIFEIKKGWFL